MTDLDLTHSPDSKITKHQAITIYLLSLCAMIPGWLFASYVPIWFAPPVEGLGKTFLFYLLTPCVLWGCVPFLLWHRWKITLFKDALLYWFIRYGILISIWGFIFLLTFGGLGANKVYFDLTFSEFNDVPANCTSENADDGHITYNCIAHQFTTECDVYILWWREDGETYPCQIHYTFEGREGLPFVWYTGVVKTGN